MKESPSETFISPWTILFSPSVDLASTWLWSRPEIFLICEVLVFLGTFTFLPPTDIVTSSWVSINRFTSGKYCLIVSQAVKL
ncbi:hypothetical protein CUJ83_08125 [Methanocella sp. CWC-04]|uniref:Uncharacterized protein n=1 Tax=Methanooceanicella nereidis TaxID=2052831 RepID=A0AAP2RCN0_9EURY|nr:hypothetical protein [Methanocella sp. CWC-04]